MGKSVKHVREEERAANSQAAAAEGHCRMWVHATEPVTTLRVLRNTLSSLNILEQLTTKNFLETQIKDPGNY